MIKTDEKLASLHSRIEEHPTRIMIIGLGSVGNYLLSYLLSNADERMDIVVAGRDEEKMKSDVNIAVVAALIRGCVRSHVHIVGGVDLENSDSIASCITSYEPDIIVNTSRVYSGLKYGSISWTNVRAYGIWTPLSIRYIRNIMEACDKCSSKALVINTSYSDGTIPWLKSAGKPYPDFGSGNLNHIVPRVKLAASSMLDINDYWNIKVDISTAHFHDVVISKEGQDEGVDQLIQVSYNGTVQELDRKELLSRCAIPMPTDQKRNMMNASSNFDIIQCILKALRESSREKFFSPGAFGEIGGYPVVVDNTSNTPKAYIDESVFSLEDMRQKNRESIALDGVEDISEGTFVYTDVLITKVRNAFGVDLPKRVDFDQIDEIAAFLVDSIIEPTLVKRK